MGEFALGMGQGLNYAAVKDVRINLRREVCAAGCRHGAQVKRCSNPGCTNHIVKGGVCTRHGGRKVK
jgi:hypothetical protein